ncbi:MAG: phosphoenolpyruvate--protein phosphotransferase [Rhodospirillaceae bacterium]|nr:MAG: phosphoenolpyruvate--protein phosphotransferase [Rhodospirillaceae bacterium]
MVKSRTRTQGRGSEASPERIFTGSPVGPGVAIGIAYRQDSRAAFNVHERAIPPNKVRGEQQRLLEAAAKASAELEGLQTEVRRMGNAAGEELGYLLDAYQQMLSGSRLIRGVEKRIAADCINAEAAVLKEIGLMSEAFASMDDPYLSARAADIRDVGRRLVASLADDAPKESKNLPRNAVIIADELSPADAALLDPREVIGLATMLGGVESHTAIIARSLGIPAVVAAADMMDGIDNGDIVIVDGTRGQVIASPTPATLTVYRKERANFLKTQKSLKKLKTVPAVTQDGFAIKLQANVELPSEIDAVLAAGAEAIGLFRSEFMFMNRPDLPGEQEQFTALASVVRKMAGRTVTIRTLDVGADKLGSAIDMEPGPNPALGLRAIRFSLKRRKLFLTQLAAILRAGALGPIRILLPMVSVVEEVREVRRILTRLSGRLKRSGVKIADPLPPLGIMIEIPGAALAADALAAEADFFAIGTNDLTQYTLAIDRSDEQVSYLYNPLHPAVLRLIQFAAEAALAAGIPVSVCGEIAGDDRFTPLLLGFGISELSMAPASLPKVKKRILELNLTAVTGKVRRITAESDPARILALLEAIGSQR